MEMFWFNNGEVQTMSTLSNRLDFEAFIGYSFTAQLSMRNILNFGEMPKLYYPFIADAAITDQGRMDMTYSLASDSSYFAYSQFDRAFIKYTEGNLEISVGRQRINWGINMVWTPNDIFNSFNYLDFDYAERAGSDAALIQYYTGPASSIQFAYKLDHLNRATYALMYKFNTLNYDFQIMSGKLDRDLVIGGGWSGQIGSAGFLGEFTYFHSPKDHISDFHSLVASVSLNYTFKNNVFTQTSILYNSAGTNENAGRGNFMASNRPVSAKDYTLAKWALFGQISFPLSPLISADFSGIFNPGDNSSYLGPSFNFSVAENFDLMFVGQFFMGSNGSEYGDYGTMLFTRLRWSF
ncbi:MAG: hypothetical protein CL663_02465 [Bacteroidetes bacterium]|nr:hypothetical protein [Bacteroidota bacterium]